MPAPRLTTRRAVLGLMGLGAVGAISTTCATRRGPSAETLYPPLGRFVTVDRVRLHLLETGPADAPAIVLIHGASGNLRDFAFAFIERLSADFRVIAIDRPGFGHSQRGPGGAPTDDAHDPRVQARLMRRAVAAIGVDRALILGHSWGACAALAWAVDAPDSVNAVVTLSGVTHPWEGSAGVLYDLGAGPLGGFANAALHALVSEETAIANINRIFRPQNAPEGYARYVGVGLALRAATLRANADDIARLPPILREQRRRYPDLAMPIEILHGTADDIVSYRIHGSRLAAEAPTARIALLDGVGHMPHHVAPDACRAAIDRAISRAQRT